MACDDEAIRGAQLAISRIVLQSSLSNYIQVSYTMTFYTILFLHFLSIHKTATHKFDNLRGMKVIGSQQGIRDIGFPGLVL